MNEQNGMYKIINLEIIWWI